MQRDALPARRPALRLRNLWLHNGYRFRVIASPAVLVAAIERGAREAGLTGSVLVAPEGINVALFGERRALEAVLADIHAALGCALADPLWTAMPDDAVPFRRLRVRERAEIVTFGESVDGSAPGAQDVRPADWNALIARPDVRVIDVRNDYEVEVGSFERAIDPGTQSFTEFRDYVERELAGDLEQPIAMFCTGGIRCAKAGAWMRSRGFTQLFQLQGGILGYLADPAADTSAWRGECFVFDDREQRPGTTSAGQGDREGVMRDAAEEEGGRTA